MSNYSKDEIQEFREKDKRINRVAVLKSLIESGRNAYEQISENCQITEQYVEFIYNGLSCKKETKPKITREIMWNDIATELNLPPIKVSSIKILDSLWNKCKGEFKLSANPAILLGHIWDKWHKYPESVDSIETIIKTLKN